MATGKIIFLGFRRGSSPPSTLVSKKGTLPKTDIDPDNGPLEECFPLPTDVVFRVHGIVFQGVLIFQADTGEDRHSN